eukprot:5724617-Pyramimonas_sp.AAC.2
MAQGYFQASWRKSLLLSTGLGYLAPQNLNLRKYRSLDAHTRRGVRDITGAVSAFGHQDTSYGSSWNPSWTEGCRICGPQGGSGEWDTRTISVSMHNCSVKRIVIINRE